MIWSKSFFSQFDALPFYEEASEWGLTHGISLSTHGLRAQKSMMSFTGDRLSPGDPSELFEAINDAKVLAACVHQVAHNLWIGSDRPAKDVVLTQRERECLQWVAVGKTTSEISDIMGVSQPTVSFHVKNIMRKLDVHNRPQALSKAMRLGILG